MFATLVTSFATLFATIGPIEAAVIFATLTSSLAAEERRRLAIKAVAIASLVLVAAMLAGGPLLAQLGVTIPALQTAGGIILLLIALDMIFARPTSLFKMTSDEDQEAQHRDDLAVFPLATPLIAGPGAISAVILLTTGTGGFSLGFAAVGGALALVMLIVLIMLLAADRVARIIGVTAQRVLMRVFGILLAAIAVQAMFNGIGASGLVTRA